MTSFPSTCSGAAYSGVKAPAGQLRHRGRLRRFAEKLGDAEIKELYLPIVGDENIGGLEVAVQNQIAVRRLDRRQNVEK